MRIDVTDGCISFAEGIVGPDLDRPGFLRSPMGVAARQMLVNQGWINYDINPESGVSGTIMFKDDRLRRILLLMYIPTDDKSVWTEELEQLRKLKHDAWLRAELGAPPYTYPWGSVASEFDPRGCVSDIIVSYAE